MKILLTGPSGRIGPHVVEAFRTQYELTTFDLPGHGADFEGDLGDLASLRRAMQGVDCVIHLAATSDEAPFIEELVPNNVIGLYNVFEAARLEKVRRFIYASSIQAVGAFGHNGGKSVETDELPRPNSLYGVTKVLGETMGRYYHDQYKLEFLALRLGAFRPYDSDWLQKGIAESIWLSPRDLNHILRLGLEKPDLKYAIVNATSKTSQPFLSLQSARETLGFEPIDDSRDFYSAETFEKSKSS